MEVSRGWIYRRPELSEEFVRGRLTCRELAEEVRRKIGYRGSPDKKRGEEQFVLVSGRAATFCVMDNNAASPDFLYTFSRPMEDQSYANVQTETYLTKSAFPSVYSAQKFLECIMHIDHPSRILSSATRSP